MENWPVDSRVRDTVQFATRRPGPRKAAPEPFWETPVIDNGTWTTSRILIEGDNRSPKLSWSHVNSTNTRVRISTGNTRCIFPPTRYSVKLNDGLSFERKVLCINAWLRKHSRIEDIEAVFLRQVLQEDENYRKKTLEYDPYCSDLLAIGFITKGHRKRAGILAYPMGQYFSSMGVSVLFDEKWGTVVSPVEKPCWEAPGPILQITGSGTIYKPSAGDYTNAGCLFSVRTFFDVSFVSVAPKPGSSVPAKAIPITSFGRTDIGGHRPFDIAFNPHSHIHESLVVSDIGTVWKFELGSKPCPLYSTTNDTTTRVGANDLPYWGLGWTAHPETFLLGSQSSLSLYDRRSPDVVSILPVRSEILTSFNTVQNEDSLRIFLSGTDHVTLVDERMFDRPVVSWAHRREYDRTLRVKTLEIGDKQLGLLTSKRSSFISVYDPILPEGEGPVICDTYGLEWGASNRCISTSIATYIPPIRTKTEESELRGALFHLSHTGAIYRQDLVTGPCKPSEEDAIWAHELQSLTSMVKLEHEEYDEIDLTNSRNIPLCKEYKNVFMDDDLQAGGPSFIEVVELAPTAFQRSGEAIDRIMTLHDMVRMVSQEMLPAVPRSLFASSRSLPLPKAELLLKYVIQLRSQSRESAPWSWDISVTQALICPALTSSPSPDDLAAFSTGGDTSENIVKKDEEARQEIALDLALAMTTYSVAPFQPSRPRLPPAPVRDDDDMLSIAASALTLEDTEPPHMHHVQPCPTIGLVDGKQGAEQRQSLVTRLLAMEWDPDSSPNDYEFFDPYNQDRDETTPAWKLMAQTKADKQSLERAKSRFLDIPVSTGFRADLGSMPLPLIQISRPGPPIIPKPVAVRTAVPLRHAQSQPEPLARQTTLSQTHEPLSSQMGEGSQVRTQVVPGPFGGRSNIAKKKKSRLPGF